MDHDLTQRFRGLTHLVGNTPLLAIDLLYEGRPRRLFAKAENVNLTGSIKDRMALHILQRAYERGALRPGGLLVEATSGNTGISFAALGRALGHPVSIFMPDWMSRERIDLIRSLGARIHLVSREEGGFLGSIRLPDLDRVVAVDDSDAILMARKLASQLGLGVGISSGANLLGALQVQNELGEGAVVVTVFPDDNKKYLSTDLLKDEPARDDHLSPAVELLGFYAYKRVCHTCCDPADCLDSGLAGIPLPPCPRRQGTFEL